MITCPVCRSEAPDGARFCPACGQVLAVRQEERRVVTVLFADIVGFTTLSETRDPEHVKYLIDRCFQRLVTDVTDFGGRVDKIVGDAIIALFGAPVAHEDDAERAVRAALAMQRTMVEIQEGVRLRVGVNTGEVLTGAIRAGGDYTAMGDVVNVASRLQTLAQPGQVVVGPSTHAATADVLRYEPLGLVHARGREEPVDAWLALEALAPPGYRPLRTKAPLVGRDAELTLLRGVLDTSIARRRAAQVLVLGDAGVGKSRLAEELAEIAVSEHGASVLEARCVPYGEANVWWPLAEAVRQACGLALSDTGDVADEKLRICLAGKLESTADNPEVVRTADGLSFLLGEVGDVDPARARDEAQRALATLLERMATDRPLVFVLSELHWAEFQVLDMISNIMDELRSVPIMFLGTARPELQDTWRPSLGRHNGVLLHLDPLSREDSAALLGALLPTPPSSDLEAALLERGGGNPFFLEELAALLSEGAPDVGELPATLRGLVAARLDALTRAERSVLDDAAVVGRRGTLAELGALAEARGESDWAALVDVLVGREMLSVEDEELAFRSDLVREVAYETLTKADRARRHATLATRLSTGPNPDVGHLAFHYSVAAQLARELGTIDGVPDDIDQVALDALEKAAANAIARDLHLAGTHFLDSALEITGRTGPAARRVLLVRAGARAALHDLDGALADLEPAMAEAEAEGDWAGVARALTVLGEIQHKEGATADAVATLERAVSLWQELGDERGEADAYRQLGMAHIWSGDPDSADAPIRQALEISRRLGNRRGEAWALQNLAWIAFDKGQAELADERLHKAISAFSDVSDYGGLGWALGLLGWVRFYQGRLDDAEELAVRILDELAGTGERWGLGMMSLLLAVVRLWQGRTVEALDRAAAAQREFHDMGDGTGEFRALGTIVRGRVAIGRVEDGVAALRAAAANAPTVSEAAVNQVEALTTNIAVQVGDPSLAPAHPSPDPPLEGSPGWAEVSSQLGLLALQEGRTTEAVEQLDAADRLAVGPNRRAFSAATLALAYAAAGRPDDADRVAADVAGLASTYLDRSYAAAARGFAAAQRGSADDAEAAFATAMAEVDGTDDVLSQAVIRLAYGRALEALGGPLATPVLVDARTRLNAIGISAQGWDTAFSLAAHPEATPQGQRLVDRPG